MSTRSSFARLAAGALISCAAAVSGSVWAADVGVSIGISQPGVYGRIDIGRFPQPQVVYAQPVIIAPAHRVVAQPVYMWVPPGHRKNWKKHCGSYGACGVPVVFVRDDWYDQQVRPHGGKQGRGYDHDQGRGSGKHKGRRDD